MDSIKKARIEAHNEAHIWIRAQFKALLIDKASIAILIKYFDYSNVFLAKFVVKLLEYTKINDHANKLEERKKPFFGQIYSLMIVELEILKRYIEANLIYDFIQLFKFLTGASILFNQKLDKSLYFYMNY